MDEFRKYLSEIPDELLVQVTEDFVWLAAEIGGNSVDRLRYCREECTRRAAFDHPHAA